MEISDRQIAKLYSRAMADVFNVIFGCPVKAAVAHEIALIKVTRGNKELFEAMVKVAGETADEIEAEQNDTATSIFDNPSLTGTARHENWD